MANDMNSVNLTGRLTRDAELKFLNTGMAVSKFSIAVNRYGGKDKPEEVSFFDVTLWGKAAEAVSQYLTKGKKVGISGEIKQERWEQDGQARSKVAITANNVYLLESKESSEQRPPSVERQVQHPGSAQGPEKFDDDSIPF